MRVKRLIERALRRFPPLFRLGSKAYHAMNPEFRSASVEAPEAIRRAMALSREEGDDPGDFYEFGIFRGFTFLTAYNEAVALGLDNMRFFGFDSFQGLPDVDGVDKGNGQFFKGQYACSREQVEKNLTDHGVDFSRATLIQGYYSESLTEPLREQHAFRRAAVVMLDCDLYASTRDALNWVAPYLHPGTILVFDDWMSYDGAADAGQPLAFEQFLDGRSDLDAEQLYDYKRHGRVFRLTRSGTCPW